MELGKIIGENAGLLISTLALFGIAGIYLNNMRRNPKKLADKKSGIQTQDQLPGIPHNENYDQRPRIYAGSPNRGNGSSSSPHANRTR